PEILSSSTITSPNGPMSRASLASPFSIPTPSSSSSGRDAMSGPVPSSQSFLDTLRSERRDLLNRLRQTRFSTLKEGYSQTQIIPYASYSPWLDDKIFLSLFSEVKDCTLVDIYRCHELYVLARQMRSVQGGIVEV